MSTDSSTQDNGTKLHLDSLEIKNFRAFRHLQIERLGRVNLITGKNSVGKSCLLEALRLYADNGSPLVIRELLQERDENTRNGPDDPRYSSPIDSLFHGRNHILDIITLIQIGPAHNESLALKIGLNWHYSVVDEDGFKHVHPVDNSPIKEPTAEFNRNVLASGAIPGLRAQRNQATVQTFILKRLFEEQDPSVAWYSKIKLFPYTYVSAKGLTNDRRAKLWDNVTLTSHEDIILNTLSLVIGRVERVNLKQSDERAVIVRLTDSKEPIPLRSLGDGLLSAFNISLALVNAEDGLLLIDEIENGLHHSVQYKLWQMIFTIAKQLNVQVFATTHSWDCIQAFQQAATESEGDDGLLIRLQRKGEDIVPVVYEGEELAIATQEQIEVR